MDGVIVTIKPGEKPRVQLDRESTQFSISGIKPNYIANLDFIYQGNSCGCYDDLGGYKEGTTRQLRKYEGKPFDAVEFHSNAKDEISFTFRQF